MTMIHAASADKHTHETVADLRACEASGLINTFGQPVTAYVASSVESVRMASIGASTGRAAEILARRGAASSVSTLAPAAVTYVRTETDLGYTVAPVTETVATVPAQRVSTGALAGPGVYTLDGTTYVVRYSRGQKDVPTADRKRYALKVVEISGERVLENGETVSVEFVYAPGIISRLSDSDRVSIADAEALSIRYGQCVMCSRALKAAESVKAGMGPVCRKYVNG